MRDARAEIRRARLDDDLAREAGDLVDLLHDGDAFDEVAELHDAADLGEDRRWRTGPTRRAMVPALNLVAVLMLEHGAVHEAVVLALAAGVVHDDELAVAVHDDDGAVLLLGELRVAQAHGAFGARLERALLDLAARRRATDVERAHRELGARLADRLRRDDADGLADVDAVAAREVAAVAHRAHAATRLAREHRADDDLFDAGVLDLAQRAPRRAPCSPSTRTSPVSGSTTSSSATRPRMRSPSGWMTSPASSSLVTRMPSSVPQSNSRDDGVLRDVDETTGEVTGVRRLERGVGEALAGAVRRDEVLQHREAFAEVRGDRGLDDLARRLGHQTAHGGELAHLLGRASSARVGHDVDRVEARLFALLAGLRIGEHLLADDVHHLVGDAVGDAGPDVDDLVVALAVGDEAFLVLIDDALRAPPAPRR